MIKLGNFGDTLSRESHKKGGKALILVSFTDYPKGGLRWTKEVTPYG